MGQNDRRSPIMNPPLLTRALTAGLMVILMAISSANAQTALDKVSFGTNWVPEAEHGGFFQALADGTYKNYGLDVTIVPGGPNENNRMLLIAGKIDFFMSANSLQSFDAAANNVPVVAVAAMFQKDPQVFVTHPESKVAKLEDLKPVVILLADYGFNTYSTLIETRRGIVDKKPDLVQRFVDASIVGWYHYLYGDNAPGNAMIKKLNPEMTDELLAYSVAKMKEYGIVDSGDTLHDGIGAMTDARVTSFFDKMVRAGVVRGDIDFRKSYTLRFVNKGVGQDLRPKNQTTR